MDLTEAHAAILGQRDDYKERYNETGRTDQSTL